MAYTITFYEIEAQNSAYFDTVDKQNAFGSNISAVWHAWFNHALNRWNGSFTSIFFSRKISFSLLYFVRSAVRNNRNFYFIGPNFVFNWYCFTHMPNQPLPSSLTISKWFAWIRKIEECNYITKLISGVTKYIYWMECCEMGVGEVCN